MENDISDYQVVDLTSNFFVLYTNMKAYSYNYSSCSGWNLACIFIKRRVTWVYQEGHTSKIGYNIDKKIIWVNYLEYGISRPKHAQFQRCTYSQTLMSQTRGDCQCSSTHPWVPTIPRLTILKVVHMYFLFVMATTFLSLNAAQRRWRLCLW